MTVQIGDEHLPPFVEGRPDYDPIDQIPLGPNFRPAHLHGIREQVRLRVTPFVLANQIDIGDVLLITDELVMDGAGFGIAYDDGRKIRPVKDPARYAKAVILGSAGPDLVIGVSDTEDGWSPNADRPGTKDPPPEAPGASNVVALLPREKRDKVIRDDLGTTGRGMDITRALAREVRWSRDRPGKTLWAVLGGSAVAA